MNSMNYLFSNDYIIWLVMYAIFTLFFYIYGIKADWQKKRIEQGLDMCKIKHSPCCFDKYYTMDKYHIWNCIILLISTSGMSGIIMLIFYLVTNNKNLSNISTVITSFLSLLFIFFTVAGAPLETDDVFKEGKEKMLIKVINAISFLKLRLIEDIVSQEYNYCQEFIIKTIKALFRKNERTKQGILVMRINTDFFNMILPKVEDISKKEEFRDYGYRILLIYKNHQFILIDELEKLFRDKVFTMGVPIIDIIHFMGNLQYTDNMTQDQIDNYIDEHVNKRNIRSTDLEKKSVSDLEGYITSLGAEIKD